MRSRVAVGIAVIAVAGTLATPALATRPQRMEAQSGPQMGAVPARDAHGGGSKPTSSVNMSSHGGAIMTTVASQAIFWGTSWANYSGDKESGLDSWYSGFGGSHYAATSNEYTGTNGQVTSSVSYSGHVVDTTAAPSGGPSTSTILNEVIKMIPNPVANGYYPVYIDQPRGNLGYCAWHSYGTTATGTPIQFAFFFNLDGDAGCDPGDTTTSHSQGLAALANVSGHELSEARTDPRNGGWYDRQGAENGDKCAWTFGSPTVTFRNGSVWKIQGEWSNQAFNSGSGYPNNSGQKGCLGGA